VRFIPAIILIGFVFPVLFAPLGQADAWPPTLTIIDEAGTPHTAPDNSTVFTIIPGGRCEFKVEGQAGWLYWLVFSANSTGNPTGQFILPPYTFLVPGLPHNLDANGEASIPIIVPRAFVEIGVDWTRYFQGAVYEPGVGIEYTNGITVTVEMPSVNADMAVHYGSYPGSGQGLNDITMIGRVDDDMAEDNVTDGLGLSNGESIDESADFTGDTLAYLDGTPGGRFPDPANSIFLNGTSYLVPGDAGIHSSFTYNQTAGSTSKRAYPMKGSQMKIHSRDAVCRNAENMAMQHIVIPPIEGGLQKDIDLYHVHIESTNEWGFMTLNVETNEFEKLSGSFVTFDSQKDISNVSPWDCNVAISPDRKLMAAVRKWNNNPNIALTTDELYLIRLDNTEWDPVTNPTATQRIIATQVPPDNYAPAIFFPETMTFLATDTPDVYALFFATNYYGTGGLNADPPAGSPSAIWWYMTDDTSYTLRYFDRQVDLPPVGAGRVPKYMGETYGYQYSSSPIISELNWIKSEDDSTLAIRVAGRNAGSPPDPTVPWEWDILVFTGVKSVYSCQTYNITGNSDPEVIVLPFGRCFNGTSRAALSPDGSRLAFTRTTVDTDKVHEDLYCYATDASDLGKPGFLATSYFDFVDWQAEQYVADPYFVDNETMLFFAGVVKTGTGKRYTDLFLYDRTTESFVNLTKTGTPEFPFVAEGNVSPYGYFVTDNKDFLYFIRGKDKNDLYMMNVVGVDLTSMELFSLTGKEFNASGIEITPEIALAKDMGPEEMNFIYPADPENEMVFFKARYLTPSAMAQQVFMMDLVHPFAALPVTSFNTVGVIDNLVVNDDGMMAAFSRSSTTTYPDQTEKIFALDINAYGYTRDLTPDYNFNLASVDGSLRFIPGDTMPPNPTAPQLVYAYGMGTSGADNPFPARAFVYPVSYVSAPSIPSISYPVTEAGSVFIYSAKP